MRLIATLAALLLGFALHSAQAAEVGGVKIEDKVRVGDADLMLNGAGIRKRLVISVYAAGLYLQQKQTTPAGVVGQAGPKRIAMTMMRDVGAQTLVDALVDGIKSNTPNADAFKAQTDELAKLMLGLKEAKKGDVIAIDLVPNQGTVVLLNGKPQGNPIPDAKFYDALLRIWLGDKPVDESLKKGLLGG